MSIYGLQLIAKALIEIARAIVTHAKALEKVAGALKYEGESVYETEFTKIPLEDEEE